MSYHKNQVIHVLSIINRQAIYWYSGILRFPSIEDGRISDTVWFIESEGRLFKIDTTKIITVAAEEYPLPTGTFTPQQISEITNQNYSEEIKFLNVFPIINIDLNTGQMKMKINGNQNIILPITRQQLKSAQQQVDVASILTEIRRDNTIYIASEIAAEAARILMGISASAGGVEGKEELPSLFIQFDYK